MQLPPTKLFLKPSVHPLHAPKLLPEKVEQVAGWFLSPREHYAA